MAIDGPEQGQAQHLFEKVCRALGEHRHGAHFPRIATDIIRPTHGSLELVGFLSRAERAMYYRPMHGELLAIPFDTHGLHRSNASIMAHGIAHPRSWVGANRDRFAWVAPSYRS
ncbi:MAG: hypothetical protein ABEJ35_03185 [Halobacteriaceae archaeon]